MKYEVRATLYKDGEILRECTTTCATREDADYEADTAESCGYFVEIVSIEELRP
jgi:hypothetical protein